MDRTSNTELPGIDQSSVEAWIDAHVDQLQPPLQWARLPGGHSNLTYRVTDAQGRQAVFRRPPTGQLLPKAHDMSREWALITALSDTAVPVAPALGFCEDPDVTGAHFYLMGVVDGNALYTVDDTERWVPRDQRETMAMSFIDVLAELHAVDPDAVGLATLGKKEGYVARQLKTWYRSWQASMEPADFDDPRAHELRAYLEDHLPLQASARVVHGDYGVHNCLIGADAKVAAVLDWEISTLGDPMADLAYALNQWAEPGEPVPVRGPKPTTVPGFPDRQFLADRYARRTGADLSRLGYYRGFNYWKSAMIVHGVYARYCEGKKSTAGVDMPGLRASITEFMDNAQHAIDAVR